MCERVLDIAQPGYTHNPHNREYQGNVRWRKEGIGSYPVQYDPLSSSGEIMTDKGQQMERWMDNYSDFYSRENTVSLGALDVTECLPTMDELDSEPLVE